MFVLQGMIGGYLPGLSPMQGPIDGIVSMGSMQPHLHGVVPPPHLPPHGIPGFPGFQVQGKNILTTSFHVISHRGLVCNRSANVLIFLITYRIFFTF